MGMSVPFAGPLLLLATAGSEPRLGLHAPPNDRPASAASGDTIASDDPRGFALPAPAVEAIRPFRLGVSNAFLIGLAGEIKNPRPAYSLSADFGFPTGRAVRWHVELGYQDLNDHTGLRFSPLVLGYSIPLRLEGLPVDLEVEVLARVLGAEILFNDGFAIALSSGLGAQLVAVYGIGYLAFAPLGFEVRYAYGLERIGIDTGTGFNWPLQLTVGVEL